MTLEEIQREVQALPSAERTALAAFLKHLARVDSPANLQQLDTINVQMDAGEKVTREQFLRVHSSLKAAGM